MADIDAQIAALEAEAERALDEASATALGKAPPAGFRLTTCAEFRAIQQDLEPLRAARAAAQFTPPPAARPAPPITRPAPMPIDARSREDKIRAISAGFPVAIPAAMVTDAIASGQSVEAFALAAADYAANERAKSRHEAEIDALVAGIVGFVPTATSEPAPTPASDDRTADDIVDDIVSTIPIHRRRT